AWWAVMVEIGSFFAGGYLAGRMRMRWGMGTIDEARFRDGAHGFLVWAVGVMFGALLIAWAGGSTLKTVTQAASNLSGGAASGGQQQGNPGANFATDMLLRPAPRAGASASAASTTGTANQDQQALRREVGRIFGSTISNRELSARDRDYLAEVVASRTGLSQADAQSRVDSTIQDVQKFENDARQKADRARRYAVISGFLAAAALLIGLAAAVGGATLGGRHRDQGTVANLFGHRFW